MCVGVSPDVDHCSGFGAGGGGWLAQLLYQGISMNRRFRMWRSGPMPYTSRWSFSSAAQNSSALRGALGCPGVSGADGLVGGEHVGLELPLAAAPARGVAGQVIERLPRRGSVHRVGRAPRAPANRPIGRAWALSAPK